MSELRADTITASNGTGPVTLTKQHAAKGWSRIPDTHDALTDSFNASSIADNGTGQATVSLVSSMSNANYCGASGSGHIGSGTTTKHTYVKDLAASNYIVFAGDTTANTNQDYGGSYSIFGDLA